MISKYIVVSNDKRIPHTLVFETNIVKYDVNKFITLALAGELEIDDNGELWFDITYLTEDIYEALKSCEGITLRFYHFLDQPKPIYTPSSETIRAFDDNQIPTSELRESVNTTNNTNTGKSFADLLGNTIEDFNNPKKTSNKANTKTVVKAIFDSAKSVKFDDEDCVELTYSDGTIIIIDEFDYEDIKSDIHSITLEDIIKEYAIEVSYNTLDLII